MSVVLGFNAFGWLIVIATAIAPAVVTISDDFGQRSRASMIMRAVAAWGLYALFVVLVWNGLAITRVDI